MTKSKKPKIHLIILVVLVIIFFGIILLATTTKDITTDYSFEDEIVYSKSNFNNKIGEVVVKNNGILGSRVKLKAIRACTFNKTIGARDIDIEYSGAHTNYLNNMREFMIDIGAKDEVTLKIRFNYFPVPTQIDSKVAENISIQTYNLYLFEVDRNENKYDFCENTDKEDAFKVVKVVVSGE